VEVIATLGLTLFVLGALFQALLNQTRTNEVAHERMSEGQVARSILYRLADELRRVHPPIRPGSEPVRARRLLAFGQRNWGTETSASTTDLPAEPGEDDEIPEVEGAERFALLGTSDRILFLTRGVADPVSPIERYRAEQGDDSATLARPGEEGARIEANRWSDLRQVYYLARPLPEALEETRAEPASQDEADSSGESGEVPIQPVFGGVIRQEVRLVFSNDAQRDSFAQLRDHLFAKEQEPSLPEWEEPALPEQGGPEEIPLPDRIQTQVLTERVTAVRFRYHDGRQWQNVWSDPFRLPIAVEIQLSFDPRAADPDFLSEYLEEQESNLPGGEAGPIGGGMDSSAEEALFGYRLVVALPLAEPTSPPAASVEPSVEPSLVPADEPRGPEVR
jgi:hypothetical protein